MAITDECYHYTQCGLKNIYLRNGFKKSGSKYGGISIDNVKGLHRAIALSLIDKPGSLSGDELRFLRIQLDLSQKRLGEYLGRTDQSVAKWEKTGNIPEDADFLVRHIVRQTEDKSASYVDEVDRLRSLDAQDYEQSLSFCEDENGWIKTRSIC